MHLPLAGAAALCWKSGLCLCRNSTRISEQYAVISARSSTEICFSRARYWILVRSIGLLFAICALFNSCLFLIDRVYVTKVTEWWFGLVIVVLAASMKLLYDTLRAHGAWLVVRWVTIHGSFIQVIQLYPTCQRSWLCMLLFQPYIIWKTEVLGC